MHLQVWRKVTEAWREGYTLKPWSRNPVERLYHDYFYFHFYNLPTPKHRNGCYICYQVEGTKNHSRMPLLRGVFENQVWAPLYSPHRQEQSRSRTQKRI
uniref:Apolipoprotein B mRNA editing enzyme catalytic polypeptide-like 3Z2A isomer D n=1 Tax=Pteropus alecto TaxID=9402 RepID=A0A2R2Z4D5_PTEAL|nr:apolipoprotein B mRNA editing enzyme catalytic polypeptide-like 3Z2A isomer D [Pteropus alecto]